MVCLPVGDVSAGQIAAIDEEMTVTQSRSSPQPATAQRETKSFRGVFGYLEFDWDADAPGGVPGFSPMPAQVETVARAAID
jgi:hypothetical protein